MLAHNIKGRSKSEGGGGLEGGVLGGGSLGRLSKRGEEINTDVYPRLRVMERFQNFFSPENIDGHT